MLKRIYTLLAVVLLVVNTLSIEIQAADSDNTAGEIIDGIIDYELNKNSVDDVNEFINKALAPTAGTTPTEWFIIALARYNKTYDYTSYEEALDSYIKTMQSAKATDYQRISVACLALGVQDNFVKNTVNSQHGKSGIMSYIYGLMIMNNDDKDNSAALKLARQLGDFHLEDGGFALAGKISDTDVTAMAIQALAPYYEDSQVKQVINNALMRLSELQLEDGGFQSFGIPNCESTAQVIIALNSLGIDWSADDRFIKNGCTVLAGLMNYRLDSGAFSHTAGGAADEFANAQALMAAVSCRVAVYDFSSDSYISAQNDSNHSNTNGELTGNTIKYGLIAAIAVICIILIFINILKKKSSVNIFIVLIVGAVAAGFIYRSDIKTSEEYKDSYIKSDSEGINVTISIDCSKADSRSDNGAILKSTEYTVPKGYSVYDLLIQACQENDIQNEFEGTKSMKNVYVNGIDYLYEFDCGELSGWVYTVNGISPSVGCSNYELEDRDCVKWIYTLDQGRDIDK